MPTYRFKTQAAQEDYKFVSAAVLPIELEFEAPRNKFNTGTSVDNLESGHSVKLLNIDNEGTLTPSPDPDAPVLDGAVVSDTAIDLSWTWGALVNYWKLKRKLVGGSYSYIGGDANHKIYEAEYSDTGLTADTTYIYCVEAYGSNPIASNEKQVKTNATASIPGTSPVSQLLITIRAAILEIMDGGAAVFSSANVIIGVIKDFDIRKSTAYPCVEILPGTGGGEGENYDSQRQIESGISARIILHKYVANPSRNEGADITDLSLLASAIIRQIYRFVDRASNGNPPCSGFVLTKPNFKTVPFYEEISVHVNTEVMEFNFKLNNTDTEL